MEERYIRNIGAITEEEFRTLQRKKVFVAGCGGLGGHIIDMLLRIGVGAISAADGDIFEESNLNRQLLSDTKCLGKSKAAVAKIHAELVNPYVHFTAFECFITEDNAYDLISGCDLVIDALDSIESRRTVFKACSGYGIPFIHGAINGWTAQASVIFPGDNTLDILYPENSVISSKTALSFSPPFAASLEVSLAIKYLIGRSIENRKIYIADLENMDFENIQL